MYILYLEECCRITLMCLTEVFFPCFSTCEYFTLSRVVFYNAFTLSREAPLAGDHATIENNRSITAQHSKGELVTTLSFGGMRVSEPSFYEYPRKLVRAFRRASTKVPAKNKQ